MKKAISIVLTVVMMFAVCVPAFAETVLNKENKSGKLNVSTTTDFENGETAIRYTITIPADTQIAWGTTDPVDVSYFVESHLSRNQAVQVEVSGTGTMKTDPANGDVYELAYTLNGAITFSADSPVVYPAAKQDVTVVIAEDSWNNAVVERYSDILTYASELVDL